MVCKNQSVEYVGQVEKAIDQLVGERLQENFIRLTEGSAAAFSERQSEPEQELP